jgi:hypothetical protein
MSVFFSIRPYAHVGSDPQPTYDTSARDAQEKQFSKLSFEIPLAFATSIGVCGYAGYYFGGVIGASIGASIGTVLPVILFITAMKITNTTM